MSATPEPHLASAKVIAGGSISDRLLRATVILTPGYASDDSEALSEWPRRMLEWLEAQAWTIHLEMRAVTYVKNGSPCQISLGEKVVVSATAAALQATWSADKDRGWIDELWCKAFMKSPPEQPPPPKPGPCDLAASKEPDKGPCGTTMPPTVAGRRKAAQAHPEAPNWKTLADLIQRSSKGKAMSVGAGLAPGGDKLPAPAVVTGETVKTATAGNASSVAISSIVPSQQSELALLLECRRALELCDSAQHMHGQADQAIDAEVKSWKAAQTRVESTKEGQRTLDLSKQFNDAYERYQNEQTNATRAFLKGGVCQPPPRRETTGTTDPALLPDKSRPELEDGLHPALDTYEASNQTQNSCAQNEDSDESRLSQVFFALQGSPTLSRLFVLTIDVQISVDEITKKLFDQYPTISPSDGGRFLYLALSEGSLCRNPFPCTVYTIAKYRPKAVPMHFWPVTAMEVGLGPIFKSESLFDLPQYDGVVVAGQKLTAGKATVPRFELTSLDVRTAAEAALDRRDSQLTKEEIQQQVAAGTPSTRPPSISRKTFTTAGIVVLDRGRQGQALAQFAARNAQLPVVETGPYIVLDADDLLTGYRFDVGVPLAGDSPTYAWRTLMAREMRYGCTGLHASRVKAIAPRLFLEGAQVSNSDIGRWRQVLEDGILALPARLIPPAPSDPKAGDKDQAPAQVPAQAKDNPDPPVHVYVEEAIATWTGEPMSVTCAGPRDQKVKSPYGLPVGCVVALPTKKFDPHRRTPRLRFGWPYRVAIRPVYSGGISIPLSIAEDLYDRARSDDFAVGGSVTIPAIPEGPFRRRDQLRRYLRHERVDAPYLLIPEAAAKRYHGPMGYERAAHAVVRTVKGLAHERQQPTVTQRVFVVPSVSQSFAAMHMVFDYTNAGRPREGLLAPRFGRYGVRFDALNGGFPVVTSKGITGINGVQFVSSRSISGNTCGEKADHGDLVYSTSPSERQRPVPYYPDPAVQEYVIGVRIAGSSEYLEGDPCVIPVYAKGERHPDARPLSLTIQRTARRRARPKLQDVLSWPKPGSHGRVLGHPPEAERIPGSVEAILTLAPGEDFEVDVWCIPDAAELACRFALVESIGVLGFARAARPLTKATVCRALGSLLPEIVCATFEECLSESLDHNDEIADWQDGCRGPGGLPAPGPDTLRSIGEALHDALSRRPLDELAAIRTLRATHAVDRPELEPHLGPHGCPSNEETASEDCTCLEMFRVSGDTGKPDRYSASGYLRIHLPTTGSLEISAEMASPSSDKLDDPRRGRSLRDRRFQRWPEDASRALVSKRHIFGFDVKEDGEIALPRTHVVIQRLTDIPLLPEAEGLKIDVDGTCYLPLSAVFGESASERIGTRKQTFPFTDRLARLLYLSVTAHGRHADQMRKAPSPGKNGVWLRDGEGLPEKSSSISSSAVIPVWIQAGVRPAQPAARSPVPAFLWTQAHEPTVHGRSVKTLTRRTVIRVALGRPWLSSGEDEQLGVVVWPPNLLAQDSALFEEDQVMTSPINGETARQMKLEDFYDSDLGPGGKFITRWGGDPIRTPAEARPHSQNGDRPYWRTFIPASAFIDAKGDAGTGFRAKWVPNVRMPVAIADQESTVDSTSDVQKSERIPQMLTVSLITYVPKFDAESEEFYVDIAIEHPYEAEPFLRLGLVRYQPHAPADLQVSYPVSQWTQLLPRRRVRITSTRAAHDAKMMDVAVCVEGLVASVPEQDTDAKNERPPVPKMITRVVREQTFDGGMLTRSVIAYKDLATEKFESSPGNVDAYRVAWEASFQVPRLPGGEGADSPRYFVFVEETEALLRATYLSEPVGPQMAAGRNCDGTLADDLLIDRGPRFLARIPL